MAEKQCIHFILVNNLNNIKLIKLFFHDNNEYSVRIAKDPWIFNGNELDDIEEIPFENIESCYGIDFVFGKHFLQFNFSREIIEIVHILSTEIDLEIKQSIFFRFLNHVYRNSFIIVAGYETVIDIKNFNSSIYNLINDNSMYPIYIKGAENITGNFGRFREFEIFSNAKEKTVWENKLERYLELLK